MASAIPLPVRIHLAAHRGAAGLERLSRELLTVAAWSFTAPERRDAVTAAIYAEQPGYVRGGSPFEGGLFPWEELALARPEWPRAGAVLLAGAGGGRELRVLASRGHRVLAFEPVPALAAACARECASFPGSSCLEGSYADLEIAAGGGGGPLAGLVARAPFDAVLLGWGSLAHVVDPARVNGVLAAVRRLAPDAPVVTSFYTRETLGIGGRMERLGDGLARALAALGAPGRRPPGGAFLPWAGFVQACSADEMAALASRHGYRMAAFATARPQPWALLVPDGDRPGTSPAPTSP